jgi:hypothetical protein
MALNPLLYDAAADASVNAISALLNSGFLKVYTGAQPVLDGALTGTLLVTLTFANPAFGAATATSMVATAAANTITSGQAGNTGTAGYFALVKSDGTSTVITGTVGTSGCDLNFSSVSFSNGATVSVSSFTISQKQSLN